MVDDGLINWLVKGINELNIDLIELIDWIES